MSRHSAFGIGDCAAQGIPASPKWPWQRVSLETRGSSGGRDRTLDDWAHFAAELPYGLP
jgi:hypothetical protein